MLFPKRGPEVLITVRLSTIFCSTFSEFTKNADNEIIASFFKNVQLVINKLNVEKSGYRLIANSGEDGGQEVPHFHIHILAGEKIGIIK